MFVEEENVVERVFKLHSKRFSGICWLYLSDIHYSLLCVVIIVVAVVIKFLKYYYWVYFWLAGYYCLDYSLLLIHVKSSDYINCVKLYFACDEERLFWECLLRCRTCLVSLVPSSRAVGNISELTLKGCLFKYSVISFMYRN